MVFNMVDFDLIFKKKKKKLNFFQLGWQSHLGPNISQPEFDSMNNLWTRARTCISHTQVLGIIETYVWICGLSWVATMSLNPLDVYP